MSVESHLKISISGDLGSGKSTICKLLKEKLSFRVFSMGEAWRNLAEKYKMSILELNKYSETHPLDEEMDGILASHADAPENIIFDSRLAWHFIPKSLKVHLVVDPGIAAERIYNDKRGDAEGYKSINEAKEKIMQRKMSEVNRYMQKYGIDCSRSDNYHLIIDTSYSSPESIASLITDKLDMWAKNVPFSKFWVSPKSIFPTIYLNNMESESKNKKNDKTISVLKLDNMYYVLNGQQQVSNAILEGTELVPVEILAQDDEKIPSGMTVKEFLNAACDLQIIHDWEEFHGFKYARYPK